MALLTQAEFAEKCFTTTSALSVYKSRHKILMTDSGLIDDQEPLNVKFVSLSLQNAEKRAAKLEALQATDKAISPESPAKGVKEEKKSPKKPENEAVSRQNTHNEAFRGKINDKMDVETNLKRKQTEKIEAEANLARIREERLSGQLIPTVLVKPIFQKHFQSITTEFQNTLNAMITDVAAKTKINRNVQAEFRRKIISELNISIDRSIFSTEREIDNIIADYLNSKNKAA